MNKNIGGGGDFYFIWSMRVKLVKEVDVYWKVYIDEDAGIYDI